MSNTTKKVNLQRLCVTAVMLALATALSMVKVFKMPLGGSVTLLSMLPIVMLPVMYGTAWGLVSAFVYSLVQLTFGIVSDGLLAWGLTPISLIGCIMLDYVLAFTVLGLAGVFRKSGTRGVLSGVVLAVVLRFLCHFVSGAVIFTQLAQFSLFGNTFENMPFLYSLAYNGLYMLPELALTVVGTALLFRAPQIKKICNL